jgi:alginate O-acetyltransferase complex protein AlgJ
VTTPAIPSFARLITVIIYFAVVLTPVLLLGRDGPWLGAGEFVIHGKAPFPKKFNPGAFRDFDEWFADRVGLRYPLIYAGTGLHIGLLRRPLDRHIFFGRDGWMFWTDDGETIPATMADSRSRLRFSQPELGRVDANIRAVRDRFEQCGIPVFVNVVPNKQTIYGKYLFSGDVAAPVTRFDALLRELSGPARSVMIDSRPMMRDAAAAHDPILLYPKTETHWNELGAFYGYRAIMTALARSIPIDHPETLSLDHYVVKPYRYAGGDMAVRVLFSPWRFDDAYVTVTPKVPLAGIEKSLVAHDHTLYRNPNAKGRLVVFGDSFVHTLMPFLTQNFEEVHRYSAEEVNGAVAARHQPAAVVFQMVERHGERLLRPPLRLQTLCDK